MSIPKLKLIANGHYHAVWYEGRNCKMVSMKTRVQQEAELRFARWLIERGTPQVKSGSPTVAECWAVYEARHVMRKHADPRSALACWRQLEPHFGALIVPQVTQYAIDDYVDRRDVSSGTCRKELSMLMACLRFCTMRPQSMFPSVMIEDIYLPEPSAPRDRWLRTEELQALLTAARELRRDDRLTRGERFLWLAIATAGRKGAIYDLTWDRVDFETGVVHLHDPSRAETSKRRSSVPMSPELRAVLERAWLERENDLVLDRKTEIWPVVQTIAQRAGVSGVSPHVLRHTAATHMARRGVPLWKVAKILGDTIETVERTYAKHCPDDLREAVGLVSSGLAEQGAAE